MAIRRSAGRRRLHRLVAVATVLAVLVAVAASLLTPVFDVDHIRVSGHDRTAVTDIVEAGGIGRGSALVLADTARAERRIEALPWVESVVVARSWPGTIRYEITERRPAASLATEDGRWLAADAEGRVVAELDARPADLPVVEGTRTGSGVGGATDDADQAAFRVAAALPPSVRPLVASIGWDGTAVTIHLVAGGTASVGDDADLEDKGIALASVLAARDPACIAHLDVSLPDAPVLTGIPGCG